MAQDIPATAPVLTLDSHQGAYAEEQQQALLAEDRHDACSDFEKHDPNDYSLSNTALGRRGPLATGVKIGSVVLFAIFTLFAFLVALAAIAHVENEVELTPAAPVEPTSSFSLPVEATFTEATPSEATPVEATPFQVAPFNITEQPVQFQSASKHAEDYILDPDWDFEAPPERRVYHWKISDVELNPDGVYRPMMVINGAFPGPLIECNEGDTLEVHIRNDAVNATAIHWHGIYQNTTNHMDGTIGITQCPIASGRSFTYNFQVRGQSGSYWYHGHVGLQASDGLFGPLIIHSRDEKQLQKLDYVTDRVLMVQDYYHDLSSSLMMQYLASDRENEEPIPDGILINGMNIRDCSRLPDRHCDNSTATLPIINLPYAQNHRVRFINVGALAEFQIQIDEHEFAVTEVDGTDVAPAFYHRLNIAAGQRYSIVVSADIATAESFWLRARMITHCFRGKNPAMESEIHAIIRYDTGSSTDVAKSQMVLPTSKDWDQTIEVTCKDMNASELVPVQVIAAPPNPNAFFYLRSNFEIGNWRLSRGFFNQSSWRPNVRSPTLFRAIDGLSTDNDSFSLPLSAAVNNAAFSTKHELVIQTSGVQTIDLAIQNFDDGAHPMHLHGHKYFVLARGRGHFNAKQVYPSLNLSNPLRRDTAILEAYGWLLIRFVADNPGMWALHCHVSWHTEAGLLMQFLSRADVIKDWTVPEAGAQLCQANGLELGGAPKDEIWYGNRGD